MSLPIAAYFYATNRNIKHRNRVGKRKRPQGIALMSLTARSAVFFYCQIHKCYEYQFETNHR